MEWEEPFQTRISSSSFGAKRRGSFTGWIRVMKPFIKRLSIDKQKVKYHSVIIGLSLAAAAGTQKERKVTKTSTLVIKLLKIDEISYENLTIILVEKV